MFVKFPFASVAARTRSVVSKYTSTNSFAPNPDPETVIAVVGGPELVLSESPSVTVNGDGLVAVPAGVVTVAASGGTLVVIFVALATLKLVTATPLNKTAIAPVNAVPVIVAAAPTAPFVGASVVIVVVVSAGTIRAGPRTATNLDHSPRRREIRQDACAMVTKWDLIYELRADEEHVRRLQEERAKAPDYPSSTTPYPLGSKSWWAAINAGTIERRSVEGTITAAQPTSMPDRQEFRMSTPDGSELTGVRHGDPTRYVEGLRIRLDYVTLQRSPEVPPELGTTDDVVIAVRIEHSHKRTPYLHSVLPPFPWPINFGS